MILSLIIYKLNYKIIIKKYLKIESILESSILKKKKDLIKRRIEIN